MPAHSFRNASSEHEPEEAIQFLINLFRGQEAIVLSF